MATLSPLAERVHCVREPSTADVRLRLAVASGEAAVDAADHATVLWLVLRGQVEVHAQEGDFMLAPRDWIALDAESSPRARLGPDALVLGVGVGRGTERGVSAGASRRLLFPGRGRMGVGARGRAFRLWHTFGAFAARGEQQADACVAGDREVLALIHALQAELIDGVVRCPGHSERRKRQVLLRMQRARLCLEGQAGDGLRIAELAKRINFSPWYFSKVFHAIYGIGPLQFAARMRLDHAARLLATTRLSVTEVSVACGFDNPCSFARAFRARFGMTASEHRSRHPRAKEACPDAGRRQGRMSSAMHFAWGAR